MLWSIIFIYPLMVAIRMISAIIGRASGKGLAGKMRHHYPRSVLYLMISLLLIANVIDIRADLAFSELFNTNLKLRPVTFAAH
jgi:Mn2+/Fe2+ NRAMP family transporter